MQHELHIVTPETAQTDVRRELADAISHTRVEWLTLPRQWTGRLNVDWEKAAHHGMGKFHVHVLLVARMPDVCEYFDQFTRAMSCGVDNLIVMGWGSGKSHAFAQCLAALSSSMREIPYVAPDAETLRRVVSARASGVADRLIASAHMDGRTLSVWSCEPKLYRVTADQLRPLAQLSDAVLRDFSVSSSGSRITWPRADVDLDLDSIREVVDADFRSERERRARNEAARYAGAIRTIREKHGLRQSDIPGLSEREVRRIESGERMPRFESLEKLARAHQLSTAAYLGALASASRNEKGRPSVGDRRRTSD